MKKIVIFSLFVFSYVCAEVEINIDKLTEIIRFPGLPLETIDYTKRESQVRNIDFIKVLYLKVADRRFVYPAAIYIATQGSIEKAKYDKMRDRIRTADAEQAAMMSKTGFVYLPDLDNAVACFDEIQMSVLMPSPSVVGEIWNTPYVGGLSITATSQELGLDYQIFLTGQADDDPEIVAGYRKKLGDPTPDEFRAIVKDLVQLVRESPLVIAQATRAGKQPTKGIVTATEDPGGGRESKSPAQRISAAEKKEIKIGYPTSHLALWSWVLGLIVIAVIIWAFVRSKQN